MCHGGALMTLIYYTTHAANNIAIIIIMESQQTGLAEQTLIWGQDLIVAFIQIYSLLNYNG